MANEREFDLVVFGASGVTGRYVVQEVVKTTISEPTLKWAVAGRNADKLKSVLKNLSVENVENIPIVIADVEDEASIIEMCKRTIVILNTVGPYRFSGEQIIKACVENGCHHLDVSGEPQFLESMQLKYHAKAQKAGVYVVGSCGFDSIPSDLGVQFLKQRFQGDLNSVESYICASAGPAGYNTNVATFESAIYGFAHAGELKELRAELNKTVLSKPPPKLKYPLKLKGRLFRNTEAGGWCLPFPGSDKSVVGRTQRMNFDLHNERPVSFQVYFRIRSLFVALLTIAGAAVLATLASYKFGQSLLKKYPGFFSFGHFKHGGPTKEQVAQSSIKFLLVGEGWPDHLAEPGDQHSEPPSKKLVATITGPDPAYVSTSICLVQSAITVLREAEKIPLQGGVFTPASAFSRTGLIERLTKNGLVFDIQE